MPTIFVLSLILQTGTAPCLPNITIDKPVVSVQGQAKAQTSVTTSEYQVILFADAFAEEEKEVRQKADEMRKTVIEVVKKLGGKEDNVVLTSYNILEPYEEDPNYRIEQDIQVNMEKVKDINKVKEQFLLLDGIHINSVTPIVKDISSYEDAVVKARNEAVKNARAQAEAMAASLGMDIGKPLYVAEDVEYPGPNTYDGNEVWVKVIIYFEIIEKK